MTLLRVRSGGTLSSRLAPDGLLRDAWRATRAVPVACLPMGSLRGRLGEKATDESASVNVGRGERGVVGREELDVLLGERIPEGTRANFL